MTNLTFSADTRPTSRPIRLRGCIARAREDCHLVFAISLFKRVARWVLGLWKSLAGVNRDQILHFDFPGQRAAMAIGSIAAGPLPPGSGTGGLVLPHCPRTKATASDQ